MAEKEQPKARTVSGRSSMDPQSREHIVKGANEAGARTGSEVSREQAPATDPNQLPANQNARGD